MSHRRGIRAQSVTVTDIPCSAHWIQYADELKTDNTIPNLLHIKRLRGGFARIMSQENDISITIDELAMILIENHIHLSVPPYLHAEGDITKSCG